MRAPIIFVFVSSLCILPAACGGSSGNSDGSAGKPGSGGLGGTAGLTGSGGLGGTAGKPGSGGAAGAAGPSCATSPCANGICTGTQQGCDGAWTCAPITGACTMDLASYCGCDGVTYQDSSTCPTRPYLFKGTCDQGASCNSAQVACNGIAPTCPSGQAPSVVNGCWGQCIWIEYCQCTTPTDCPSGHSCRMGAGLCN